MDRGRAKQRPKCGAYVYPSVPSNGGANASFQAGCTETYACSGFSLDALRGPPAVSCYAYATLNTHDGLVLRSSYSATAITTVTLIIGSVVYLKPTEVPRVPFTRDLAFLVLALLLILLSTSLGSVSVRDPPTNLCPASASAAFASSVRSFCSAHVLFEVVLEVCRALFLVRAMLRVAPCRHRVVIDHRAAKDLILQEFCQH